MAPKDKKKSHWAWIILAACLGTLFINYSVRLGYGVVLPEMIRVLDLDRTSGGSIFNSFLFVYIFLTPLCGYLTDRVGARVVMTISIFILGVGTFLMGRAETLFSACLAFSVAGFGSAGMWTPAVTLVIRWFSPNRRGLALGILTTGTGLGFASTGIVFPWIIHHLSYNYVWFLLGTGAFVMVFINGLLLRSSPEEAGCTPWGQSKDFIHKSKAELTFSDRNLSFTAIFHNLNFWVIGLSYFCISYALYGITTFMVDFARYQLGMSLESAGLLATLHGITQIIGVLTLLPCSDFWGRKRTVLFSNFSISVALFGVLLAGSSLKMVFIFIGVMALFYGPTFAMYSACAGDYFPRNMIGSVVGAWTSFYGIGAILVHWITGILRDRTGVYDLAFLINAVMAFIGLLLFFFVKKQTDKEVISRPANNPLLKDFRL